MVRASSHPIETDNEVFELEISVTPPWFDGSSRERVVRFMEEYFATRGYGSVRAKMLDGMGSAAGPGNVDIVFKAISVFAKSVAWVVSALREIRLRKDLTLVEDLRPMGHAKVAFTGDHGVDCLKIFPSVVGLQEEWVRVFPGSELLLDISVSGWSQILPEGCSGLRIVSLAKWFDEANAGMLIRKAKKIDRKQIIWRVEKSRILHKSVLKEVAGPVMG